MKHELEIHGDELILVTRDHENDRYTNAPIESDKDIDCSSEIKKRLISMMQFNEMILKHRSENA